MMLKGSLNTAVDCLIDNVGNKIFGNCKRMLKPDDNIIVDGGIDIFCNMFNIFY